MDARVVSIQVGKVRTHEQGGPDGKPWRSAIDKRPVEGPVCLAFEGLAGDAVADRRYHGGAERAVLVYGAAWYPRWADELDRKDLQHGFFGENLTVEGLDDDTALIGDELALGSAVLQISQPRMPCVKLGRRLGSTAALDRVFATGRTGFYLRVLEEGEIEPGPLALVGRRSGGVPVSRALRALLHPLDDPEAVAALTSSFALSEHFRAALVKANARATRGRPPQADPV